MKTSLQDESGIVARPLPSTQAVRIAVAQLGARRHYAIPRILDSAGLLEAFYTDLYSGAGWPAHLNGRLPKSFRIGPLRRFAGRSAMGIPPDRIRQFPLFGVSRRLRKIGCRTPAETRIAQQAANLRFGSLVATSGFGAATGVYVFNGAGLEILKTARSQGLRTIIDQTSAPAEVDARLLREEHERWPNWEPVGDPTESWEVAAERERAEWELADLIICGSTYVRDGISAVGGPVAQTAVVPYGVPDEVPASEKKAGGGRELRVLFAGTVCLRKGIPYVMDAARELNSRAIEFRIVGPIRVSESAAKQLGSTLNLAGPVPRSSMDAEYAWADVLVMPSISEGSANVCYEALGRGVPVITTPNSGSIVRDEIDGFVVPIRDAEALADRINLLAHDRTLLAQMSARAFERAGQFPISGYASRIVSAIMPIFN